MNGIALLISETNDAVVYAASVDASCPSTRRKLLEGCVKTSWFWMSIWMAWPLLSAAGFCGSYSLYSSDSMLSSTGTGSAMSNLPLATLISISVEGCMTQKCGPLIRSHVVLAKWSRLK